MQYDQHFLRTMVERWRPKIHCFYLPSVWCWERMLPLHPGLYEPKDDDAALPYATRWIRGIERNTESHHTLIAIRDQIDHMKEVQEYYTAGFASYVGSVVALSRGLHKILKISLELDVVKAEVEGEDMVIQGDDATT
ncbi:hypothetical protein BC332_07793 [Capsicum chinense]|nr:hypothetical protein BC332_07793 [Capsicum chinense]